MTAALYVAWYGVVWVLRGGLCFGAAMLGAVL